MPFDPWRDLYDDDGGIPTPEMPPDPGTPGPPQNPTEVPWEGPYGPWNDFPMDGPLEGPGVPSGGSGGNGGGGAPMGGGGPKAPPYNPNWKPGDAPAFDAPDFQAPDPNGLLADPSFQFRMKNSLGALENSAAAKGMLRTGATFKGLQDYAGASASQEYSNIFGRALESFDRQYRGASDEYAPRHASWQNREGWGQKSALAALQNMWAEYFHNTVSADTLYRSGLD